MLMSQKSSQLHQLHWALPTLAFCSEAVTVLKQIPGSSHFYGLVSRADFGACKAGSFAGWSASTPLTYAPGEV